MALSLVLVLELAVAAQAVMTIASADGWYTKLLFNTSEWITIGGSQFECVDGTLTEQLGDECSWGWLAHHIPNSSKVAYSTACSATGKDFNSSKFPGVLLDLWNESSQVGSLWICYPRSAYWAASPEDLTDCQTPRPGIKFNASDCPLSCLSWNSRLNSCLVNYDNATCLEDPRCVPVESRYDPMDVEGKGHLSCPGIQNRCLASTMGNVTVKDCDSQAQELQWLVSDAAAAFEV